MFALAASTNVLVSGILFSTFAAKLATSSSSIAMLSRGKEK
jgi:hypothetical protein